MSQLVKDVDLYVATPEVKEYTGAYSKPSDFTDLETSSYYNYTYNRNDRLLSGNSKSRFNTNMNGKKIELRTVIQNISDKNVNAATDYNENHNTTVKSTKKKNKSKTSPNTGNNTALVTSASVATLLALAFVITKKK